jgi:hypothetical protein
MTALSEAQQRVQEAVQAAKDAGATDEEINQITRGQVGPSDQFDTPEEEEEQAVEPQPLQFTNVPEGEEFEVDLEGAVALEEQLSSLVSEEYKALGHPEDSWRGLNPNTVRSTDVPEEEADVHYKEFNMDLNAAHMSERQLVGMTESLQVKLDSQFGVGVYSVSPSFEQGNSFINISTGEFKTEPNQYEEVDSDPEQLTHRNDKVEASGITTAAVNGATAVPEAPQLRSERHLERHLKAQKEVAIQQDREALEALIAESVKSDPGRLGTQIPFIREHARGSELSRVEQSMYEAFKADVRKNDLDKTLSESDVADIAAWQYIDYTMAKAADEGGIPEKVAEFGGLLLWNEATSNLAQVLGMEAAIDTTDFMRAFTTEFAQLPGQEKVNVYKALFDRFNEVDTNSMRTHIQLMQLMGDVSTREIEFDAAMEKLDLGFIAFYGLTAPAKVMRGWRALNAVKRVEKMNPVAAERLIISGLQDNNTANKMGSLQLELANAGDANKVADILQGASIDPAVQKVFKEHWNRMDDNILDLNDIPEEGIGLTAEGKKIALDNEMQRIVTAAERNGVEVANVKGKVDGNRIFISYDEMRVEPHKPWGFAENDDIPLRDLGASKQPISSDHHKISSGVWWDASSDSTAHAVMRARAGGHVGSDIKLFQDPEELTKYLQSKQQFSGKLTKNIDPKAVSKALTDDKFNLVVFGEKFDAQTDFPMIRSSSVLVPDADFNANIVENIFMRKVPRDATIPTRAVHKEVQSRVFNVDDMSGAFVDDIMHFAPVHLFTSSSIKHGDDVNKLVSPFVRISFADAAVKDILFKNLNLATKGLGGKSKRRLNTVLRQGDLDQKVYTWKQLTQDGVGSVHLSDKEAAAYFKLRRIDDDNQVLSNITAHKMLNIRGMKAVRHGDDVVIGKVYDNPEGAWRVLSDDTEFKRVVVEGKSTPVRILDKSELDDFYTQGYKLARADVDMHNWFKTGKDNHTAYKLVLNKDIDVLPTQVLRAVPGHVPRVSKGTNYFVREPLNMIVDGEMKPGIRQRAVASASTKAEAAEIAEKMNQKRIADGLEPVKYNIDVTDTMSPLENQFEMFSKMGGLFNSPRARKPPPHGLAGNLPDYEDVYKSLQHGINHVANYMTSTEYRHGIERMFINTVKERLENVRNSVMSLDDAHDLVMKSPLDARFKLKMDDAYKQINYMNKIPTQGEQIFQGTFRNVGEWVEGKPLLGGKPAARLIYRLGETDPVNALKAATFHLVLGTTNYAQVLVQAAGATIAMSVNPVHATRATPMVIASAALDAIPSPSTRRAAIKVLEDSGVPEFARIGDAYELWHKSGQYQGVIHTDANLAMSYRGNPIDPKLWRTALRTGEWAYKQGELINSRYSFFTALNKYAADNNLKRIADVTDDGFKDIMERTEIFKLNMTHANKAELQRRGVGGLMTQFLAVNARFVEAFAGKQLTVAEKARLFTGQALVFGSFGIPAGDYMLRQMIEASGTDPEDVDVAGLDYNNLRTGIVGWASSGFGVDFARRTALGQGFVEVMTQTVTDKRELPALLLGVSYPTVVKPTLQAIEDIYRSVARLPAADDLEPADFELVLGEIAQAILDVPSSTRKAVAAAMVKDQPILRSRDGAPVLLKDSNQPYAQKFFQAIGFTPQELMDHYESLDAQRRSETLKRELIKQHTRAFTRLMNVAGDDDRKQVRAVQLFYNSINQSFDDPNDRAEIKRAVMRSLSPSSAIGAELRAIKRLDEISSDLSHQAENFAPDLLKFLGETE